jgi:hypothetical protein
MPLQATSGAASYDAFGGGVPFEPIYIEQVFQNWLYTGNGSTQTITNGIDLAGKGGLVWIKDRNSGAKGHALFDTARGVNKKLQSQSTNGEFSSPNQLTAFNANGFDLGSAGDPNGSGTTYASWTFREAPKFFDVVTYTGTGSTLVVNHNLQSTPGFVVIKRTNTTGSWVCYHISRGFNEVGFLNATNAFGGGSAISAATSTTVTVPSGDAETNANGSTYVMYLFAHNAGGFGLTGTDNVISCGSYTGNGSSTGPVVTLGYEPQWIMIKNASASGDWLVFDNMRGWLTSGDGNRILFPNLSGAEVTGNTGYGVAPTATGFRIVTDNAILNTNGQTYIYIAIRRGPMKVPTTGTSVFNPLTWTGNGTGERNVQPGNLTDIYIGRGRGDGSSWLWFDRLRGALQRLSSDQTAAESTLADSLTSFAAMNGAIFGGTSGPNFLNTNNVSYWMRRAPGFFDEVCYTGTGSARTVTHNLAAVPELLIVKSRSSAIAWGIYSNALGNNASLAFNANAVNTPSSAWNTTTPTSTVFSLGTASAVNASGDTYVAYLFASCPGVSKVGSYTGTGTTQTINCGFTGGARFVLIKRTDSTGDWFVWDTARGIVSGNDPHLSLNTTAAEVTSNDTIDTDSTGFVVNQVSATNVNVSSATYIFLAIA